MSERVKKEIKKGLYFKPETIKELNLLIKGKRIKFVSHKEFMKLKKKSLKK